MTYGKIVNFVMCCSQWCTGKWSWSQDRRRCVPIVSVLIANIPRPETFYCWELNRTPLIQQPVATRTSHEVTAVISICRPIHDKLGAAVGDFFCQIFVLLYQLNKDFFELLFRSMGSLLTQTRIREVSIWLVLIAYTGLLKPGMSLRGGLGWSGHFCQRSFLRLTQIR